MKLTTRILPLLTSILSITALCASFNIFAKNINLYDQPKNDARVLGTVDTAAGIIPIYTPDKESGWIKVGDPRNGNVGWVKSTDLSSDGKTFLFNQRIITDDGKGPHTYQMLQYGDKPQNMTPEQTKAMMLKMQTEQLQFQQNAQKVMENMVNDLNKLYKQQMDYMKNNGGFQFPSIPNVPGAKPPVTTQQPAATPSVSPPVLPVVPPKNNN